jgi:hypothetical protein
MRPLYSGSDVIDQVVHNPSEPPRWVHDATVTPWPVPGRSYDLFVALQVWEHLRDSQVDAFREAGRVATWGLLSFPLEWNLKNADDCHHGITMAKIREWTEGRKPVASVVVSRPYPKYKRFVALYRFHQDGASANVTPSRPLRGAETAPKGKLVFGAKERNSIRTRRSRR